MRISGGAVLHATPARAWRALTDPAVLTAAIPGCETLSFERPAAAHLTLTASVASTGGLYSGRAEVTDRLQPEFLVIKAALAGESGSITATLRLQLAETSDSDPATQASYEVHADVAGDLAAIGQSLLTAAATRLATQFFESIDEFLAEKPRPVPAQVEASHIPDAGVSVTAAGHAKASVPGERPQHWYSRLPAGGRAHGRRSAAAGRRNMGASATRGQGFTPGVIVGAAAGIAAAKLGTLIARRNR